MKIKTIIGTFFAALIVLLSMGVSRAEVNDPAAPTTNITVNSSGDAADFTGGSGICETATGNGQCTLRAAIQTAELSVGGDIITVQDSIVIIAPTSELPWLTTGNITIQGNGVYLSGLNAPSGASGFSIGSNNNKIQGFTIFGFKLHGINLYGVSNCVIGTDGDGSNDANEGNVIFSNSASGIYIYGDDNRIAGNFLGTEGSSPAPNHYGITIFSGSGNLIGTDGDGVSDILERNVISGNTQNGVDIQSGGNTVAGNYIGTNETGNAAVMNGDSGIKISNAATNNVIGTNGDGTGDSSEGNLISGNDRLGVYISGTGSNYNRVAGNAIGLNANGTLAIPNGISGILVGTGAKNNTIGSNLDGQSDPAERNLISGNGRYGVTISGSGATGNKLAGNYIGTTDTGLAAVGNDESGVKISDGASNNTIGGSVTGSRNIISGNLGDGILLYESGDGNWIAGNLIGTDKNGLVALPNGENGVKVVRSSGNTVGGTFSAARNIISGNTARGVYILGNDMIPANGNLVQGNYIGVALNGVNSLGNGGLGVSISSYAQDNLVGIPLPLGNLTSGPATGGGNVIANNGGDGVQVFGDYGTTGNTIRGNAIFNNTGIGIDLRASSSDGPTPNDSNDSDTGPNNYQNYPILTKAIFSEHIPQLTIPGAITSTTNMDFELDFYVSTSCDATDYGEGQNYLGVLSLDGQSDGIIPFQMIFAGSFNMGDFVTATATDEDGNTSEFSACTQIVPHCISISVVDISGASSGEVGTSYTFTAAHQPSNATTPITYNWVPQPSSGQGTSSATYSWDSTGVKTISVNAQNCGGTRSDTHDVVISPSSGNGYSIFLPLIVR